MVEKEQKKRKRGQGEGTIYQRKDGRWTAAVITGYKNGKLQRKSYYGKTRTEVAGKLTTELSNQQKGLPPVNDRQSIAQFFKDWLTNTVKSRVSPKTFKTYSDF